MRRRSFKLVPLVALVSGCNRWRRPKRRTLYFRDPHAAFDATVAKLKQLEYENVTADPVRFHIEVATKVPESYISIQIYNDARMIVRAHGKLVRRHTIHWALEEEIDRLVAALRASGHVVR